MPIDAPTGTPSRPCCLDLPAEAGGLWGAEAKARLARFGPDVFREWQEKSLLLQHLIRFKNPLVIILLVASAVSAPAAPNRLGVAIKIVPGDSDLVSRHVRC